MPAPLAVLVVDDSDVLRTLVSHFLDGESDLQVIASVDNAEAAVDHAREHCPDVILLDHDMPGRTGLQVLPELRASCPDSRIVMFSASEGVHAEALRSGADEFIAKTTPLPAVADALRAG